MFNRFAQATIHFPYDAAMLGNDVAANDVGDAISQFCASYSTDGWTLGGWARRTESDDIYPGGFTIDLVLSWHEPHEDSAYVPETDESLAAAVTSMTHAFDGFICARFGRRLTLNYAKVKMPRIISRG